MCFRSLVSHALKLFFIVVVGLPFLLVPLARVFLIVKARVVLTELRVLIDVFVNIFCVLEAYELHDKV